jgi:signal transduction histidine kinase
VDLWARWRADLRRPESSTPDEDRNYYLGIPVAIVALAQATRPGSLVEVLLLAPAVMAYWLRAFRVRLPAELFAAIVIGSVAVAVTWDGNLEGSFFLIATMVLYSSWTLGSWTRAIVIMIVATVAEAWIADVLIPEEGITWEPWAMANLFTFVLGRTLRHQQALIEQLEATRRELAEHAVAEERRRIARELHDLAGHTLAAVLLHVTGARHVLRRDVDEAELALRDAEAVGRAGLDQVRSTVAALRADERGTDPALPGVADLDVLVDDYRRAGLAIAYEVTGDVAAVDGPVGTALHRIAREALTNVARHAPANRVAVSLTASAGTVRLRVVDSGRAGSAAPATGPHFGLVGMAERARAVGGELDAGPSADGWQVEARFPLPRRPETVAP